MNPSSTCQDLFREFCTAVGEDLPPPTVEELEKKLLELRNMELKTARECVLDSKRVQDYPFYDGNKLERLRSISNFSYMLYLDVVARIEQVETELSNLMAGGAVE